MFRCLQTLNALGLDQFSVQGLMGALALGSLGLAPGARAETERQHAFQVQGSQT